MGVASLVLALLNILSIVLMIVVVAAAKATFHDGNRNDSPFFYVLAGWLLGILLLSVCGIVFGIGGMRQPNRRHSMALAGLCVNIAIPMLLMFALLLGEAYADSIPDSETPDYHRAVRDPGSWHSPTAVIFGSLTVGFAAALVWVKRKKRMAAQATRELSSETLACPRCRKVVPRSAQFCRRCGVSLNSSTIS
jgi:ABC-type multidrug transport system permease subunit